MTGGVKRAGAPKTKGTKFGEVYFINFMREHPALSENRVRYWLKKLEIKMTYARHGRTGKMRAVLQKTEARAILRAISYNANKLKALKMEAHGFAPKQLAAAA